MLMLLGIVGAIGAGALFRGALTCPHTLFCLSRICCSICPCTLTDPTRNDERKSVLLQAPLYLPTLCFSVTPHVF